MKAGKLRYRVPFDWQKADLKSRVGKLSRADIKKRPVYSLVMIEILMLGAFILGYLINPFYLRAGWLITTGTLCILTGIAIFLVVFKVRPSNDQGDETNDYRRDG